MPYMPTLTPVAPPLAVSRQSYGSRRVASGINNPKATPLGSDHETFPMATFSRPRFLQKNTKKTRWAPRSQDRGLRPSTCGFPHACWSGPLWSESPGSNTNTPAAGRLRPCAVQGGVHADIESFIVLCFCFKMYVLTWTTHLCNKSSYIYIYIYIYSCNLCNTHKYNTYIYNILQMQFEEVDLHFW